MGIIIAKILLASTLTGVVAICIVVLSNRAYEFFRIRRYNREIAEYQEAMYSIRFLSDERRQEMIEDLAQWDVEHHSLEVLMESYRFNQIEYYSNFTDNDLFTQNSENYKSRYNNA